MDKIVFWNTPVRLAFNLSFLCLGSVAITGTVTISDLYSLIFSGASFTISFLVVTSAIRTLQLVNDRNHVNLRFGLWNYCWYIFRRHPVKIYLKSFASQQSRRYVRLLQLRLDCLRGCGWPLCVCWFSHFPAILMIILREWDGCSQSTYPPLHCCNAYYC